MSTNSRLPDAEWLGSWGQSITSGLKSLDLPTLFGFVAGSVGTGLGLYLLISIIFQIRYYRNKRSEAEAWKCQPQRFPSPRMWRTDLWLGVTNITLGSVLSGGLAYWIYTSGHSRMYLSPRGHHPLAVIGSLVLYYLVTDWVIYWAHRLYHKPLLFKLIHRYHHRNTTPTAFTAFALHPVEFLTYQSVMLVPLIFLPLNSIGVIVILLSAHIESLFQHSGVRIAGYLPWMPSTFYHDDHHRYFHVNYGQHLSLWDRLYGTLRRHGRRYGVEVFGGRGAPLPNQEASAASKAQPELVAEPVHFVDYGRNSVANHAQQIR